MITIEKLRKEGFFEVISKIKELGFSCGINDIYVIPPIVSRDTLYLWLLIIKVHVILRIFLIFQI